MDRFRNPSTAEHRPLIFFCRLFEATGLGDPEIVRFEVPFLAPDFVARSFPLNDDRAGLLAMIEASVDGDTMHLGARDARGRAVRLQVGGAERGKAALSASPWVRLLHSRWHDPIVAGLSGKRATKEGPSGRPGSPSFVSGEWPCDGPEREPATTH